jgi:hypothetical protein
VESIRNEYNYDDILPEKSIRSLNAITGQKGADASWNMFFSNLESQTVGMSTKFIPYLFIYRLLPPRIFEHGSILRRIMWLLAY